MENAAKDTGKIAKSASTVSIALMCSRVLGLIREQAFAALFGAGYAYDAFVVAFRIPNLLRDLFGEGALSSAFVTVFSDYDTKKGEKDTWQLANNVLAFFAVLVSVITLCGIIFAEPIIHLLVDAEFSQVAGKVELTRKLTVIMFPFLVFISLSAAVMGMLNTKGRFFVPAMASSFFNLGSIIGGVSLAFLLPKFGYPAIMGMAIGTLIGGFLQLAGQLPTLFKTGFALRPTINLRDPGLRRILRLMVPAVIGLSATQINIFINTRFASSCVEGSVSWLNYAFRLVQLPIGVFGVAISIATLPVISRYAAVKDIGKLKETFSSSLTMAFCLTIPASVGLWLLAEPIIQIIFQHGAFTGFDTIKTAEALRYYAIGLFAYSSVKIMVPVFFALDDSKLPVIASFLAVAANLLFVSLFIDHFQHRAIAMATSCSMIFNFLFLSVVLYRKVDGYSLGYLGVSLGKVFCGAVLMGVWVAILQSWFAELFVKGIIMQIVGLVLIIASAAVLYGVVLYGLKVKELAFVVDRIKARIVG